MSTLCPQLVEKQQRIQEQMEKMAKNDVKKIRALGEYSNSRHYIELARECSRCCSTVTEQQPSLTAEMDSSSTAASRKR